jgi:hypothetical protein
VVLVWGKALWNMQGMGNIEELTDPKIRLILILKITTGIDEI